MDTAGALPDPIIASLEKATVGTKLDHHFTQIAQDRLDSPLKTLWPYMQRSGIISLAGGLPHFSTFAFDEVSGTIKAPTALANGAEPKREVRVPMEISKAASQSTDGVQLKDALQYGTSHGIPVLAKMVQYLSRDLFEPQYEDWHAFLTASATDAFSKVCQTFLNRGDALLVDEYGYATALATVTPLGILPRGVEVDKFGMRPDRLRSALANWDEKAAGTSRPRVLYTVTVGHNPIGVSWTAERKKEIYDICSEFDILIVEDDPYFYMQFDSYKRPADRIASSGAPRASLADWKASLTPSFLKFDKEGRVIRLDTFSKTLAPGLRLGWTTCNASFSLKLLHNQETTTQSPSGFSQAFLASLLMDWGYDGYYTWCRSLGKEYETRRDTVVDALVDENLGKQDGLIANVTNDGLVTIASADGLTLLSFDVPRGGMFLWVRIHFSNHPEARSKSTKALSDSLWKLLADRSVLVAPANMFAVEPVPQPSSSSQTNGHATNGKHEPVATDSPTGKDDFFRLAFSLATEEQFKKAAEIIRATTKEFFAHESTHESA